MARRKKAGCIVEKAGTVLRPVSAFDQEQLEKFQPGTEFELRPIGDRSNRQLRTYWQTLDRVVEATGRWASRYPLSDALLIDVGHCHVIKRLDGEVQLSPMAIHDLGRQEFDDLFQRVMARLSEAVGYDVLAYLEENA